MLAKSVKGLPDPATFADAEHPGLLFEPKWDGFRCLVFKDGDEVELTSRNTKPLTRYFPEVVEASAPRLPDRCVARRRDHRRDRRPSGVRPAAGPHPPRRLAGPDAGGDHPRGLRRVRPARARRRRPHRRAARRPPRAAGRERSATSDAARPPHRRRPPTPRRPRVVRAVRGRGSRRGRRQAARRRRTSPTSARCSRSSTSGPPTSSWPATGCTRTRPPSSRCSARCCSGCTTTRATCGTSGSRRRSPPPVGPSCSRSCSPLVAPAEATRGAQWPEITASGERVPGAASRWNAGKDLSFVPLRPERVLEVGYDHMEGERFRHTAQFKRWRTDRDPRSCTLRPARGAGLLRPRRRARRAPGG